MKDIAVIGLGKFGQSVATTYSKSGGNVIAIDSDEEKVQEVADIVTYAVKADITDVDVVKNLGLSNVEVAVIAISDNLEASVMAVILCKEEGVPYIVAKAQNEIHGRVLKKVGADNIVYPEKEMGYRLARTFKVDNLIDMVDLSEEFSIIEIRTPKEWVGKSLIELNVRKKYDINIIAVKCGGEIDVTMDPNRAFREESSLVIIGRNDLIDKTFKRIK